jgi:LPS-assembly protein
MRKGSLYILWIAAVLGISASILFLSMGALAKTLPMPNFKGQFKKQDLKNTSQVELQADQVSFSSLDNKAHAKGNVVVNTKDQQLYSDQLDLDRTTQEVVAEGHVYLDASQENVIAQGLNYNFNNHTGEFRDARVFIDPYQIKGQKIDKVSENHMSMDEGYLTTCDLDEPHFRMGAHRMDIYPKNKAVVRGLKVYLGKVPVMYLPYYVQDLKNRSIFTFIPGESKDFGLFLLTTTRLQLNSNVKVNLHADVRERNGFGEGFDVKYNTPNFGSGLVSAYYTDENKIAGHHLWDQNNSAGIKKGPTTHHERYRVIWRHRWQIDNNTDAVLQYYKIHDFDIVNNGFLKTYFPREYQQNAQNANLDTYFLLTRNMPHGTLTFDVDTSRENRPIRGIERIPEVRYILNNRQIGHSGFYFKSANTFSDLSHQDYPKTFNQKTLRFDTNNDVSHPFKVGFIRFNPHLGGENTYYSRTADPTRNNILRGMFRGSLDMSTKFYKFWDYHTKFAGMNINGLRHVITPTITYLYQARPTFPASRLDQFDPAIDNLFRIHQFEFGLENKLQTKRNGQIVDLLRFLVSTNYGLKGTTVGPPAQTIGLGATGRRGFNPYDFNLDFYPTDWLSFHSVDEYDFHAGHANAANFDGGVHFARWSFDVGSLYAHHQGQQVTTEFKYRINPKWAFSIYNRFEVSNPTDGVNSGRENGYILTRDLHEWEMEMSIDQQQGHGTTFFVLFRLKALPDMKLNLLRTSYSQPRPGSQH